MEEIIKKTLLSKSDEEKEYISSMLNSRTVFIKDMEIENLIDAVSVSKSYINEYLTYISGIKDNLENNSLYISKIESKKSKIENLIQTFNNSYSKNKITFENNLIEFDYLRIIEKLKLEIDNFDYSIPINFSLRLYCYDGEIAEYNIIPFNFNGIYSEYLDIENNKSIFKVSNKDSLYFYNCIYTEEGFRLGTEINLEKGKDYVFNEEGKLEIDFDRISYKNLLVKYMPNENAFEFDKINKKVFKIELSVKNDKIKISDKLIKKVILDEQYRS